MSIKVILLASKEIKMTDQEITCSLCGSHMIKKSGPFGEFMGCSAFSTTNCRGRQRVPRDQQVINKSVINFFYFGDQS